MPSRSSVPMIAFGPERVVMKPSVMRSAADACDPNSTLAAIPSKAGQALFIVPSRVMLLLLPKLFGGDIRPLSQRLELFPDHRRMDLGLVQGLGRVSAVPAGHDVLTPDQLGEPHDALGDHLGMLDDVARMGDHA